MQPGVIMPPEILQARHPDHGRRRDRLRLRSCASPSTCAKLRPGQRGPSRPHARSGCRLFLEQTRRAARSSSSPRTGWRRRSGCRCASLSDGRCLTPDRPGRPAEREPEGLAGSRVRRARVAGVRPGPAVETRLQRTRRRRQSRSLRPTSARRRRRCRHRRSRRWRLRTRRSRRRPPVACRSPLAPVSACRPPRRRHTGHRQHPPDPGPAAAQAAPAADRPPRRQRAFVSGTDTLVDLGSNIRPRAPIARSSVRCSLAPKSIRRRSAGWPSARRRRCTQQGWPRWTTWMRRGTTSTRSRASCAQTGWTRWTRAGSVFDRCAVAFVRGEPRISLGRLHRAAFGRAVARRHGRAVAASRRRLRRSRRPCV